MSKTTKERVRKAWTKDYKIKIAKEWIESWETDQADTVARLCAAARSDDHDTIVICSGQLRGMTENRFIALRGIIDALTEGLPDGGREEK